MHPFYSTVAERAHHRCEYCQAPELVFNFPFEIEHIVPLSRNGTNDLENLALACRSCNLHKGNRVSGKLQDSNDDIRFFHPRIDNWAEHFRAGLSGEIVGISSIGLVTAKHLEMNSLSQITARLLWIRLDLFP